MTIYQISIEPLEPLLFGDNRSARAGVDHVLQDQDPSPLTLHGAIGQSIVDAAPGGWPEATLGDRVRDILAPRSTVASLLGYCLCAPGGDLFFPRPAHLRCVAGSRRRGAVEPVAYDLLTPHQVESSTSSVQPALPALVMATDADQEETPSELSSPVLLGESALGEVLCGTVPEDGLSLAADLYRSEARPGIAVDNRGGTVVEGAFFTRPYRRFAAAANLDLQSGSGGLSVWFETLTELAPDRMPTRGFVGGDRRRARLGFAAVGESRREGLAGLRKRVEAAAKGSGTQGFLLYLLTPALAQPELPTRAGEPPFAAALGKPAWISGWDTARRQPRKIETVAPAGSVVFYRWPEGVDRSELVQDLWLEAWNERGSAAGFGRTLVGVW